MKEKKDLRSVKTMNAIEHTLIDLLVDKTFQSITVDEIAKKAVINRSTFYLHYHDKYHLLDDISDKKIKKVINTIHDEPHIRNEKLDSQLFSNDLEDSLNVIAANHKFYQFILNDNESLGLRKKMEDALFDKLSTSFPVDTIMERELLLKIISAIYTSVISWWLNKNMIYSVHYMSTELVKFFKLGTINIINGNYKK